MQIDYSVKLPIYFEIKHLGHHLHRFSAEACSLTESQITFTIKILIMSPDEGSNDAPHAPTHRPSLRERIADILRPASPSAWSIRSEHHAHAASQLASAHDREPQTDDHTPLLGNYDRANSVCGLDECNHGTFSPKPRPDSQHSAYDWERRTSEEPYPGYNTAAMEGLSQGEGSTSITKRLARESGIKNRKTM